MFVLKAIRIKLHNRDVRILTHIKNNLKFGRIIVDKTKPHSIFIVSDKLNMTVLLKKINGLIRLKLSSFTQACLLSGIILIEPTYQLSRNDPYFAGLVDTDGAIVFNYKSNRIECCLELKNTIYSKKLDFDNLLPDCKPSRLFRCKKNQTVGAGFHYISFKYQTVNAMLPLYEYFMQNRLYSDFKFYRISKIKKFIEIRHLHKYAQFTPEFQIYANFVLDWIKYLNPLWYRVPFVKHFR